METEIGKFIRDQLSVWPLAAANYRDLRKVRTKTLTVGGVDVIVQFNPCRKVSSEAALDPESIAGRPCFLCPENRPQEQYNIDFEGRKGKKYRITLNPFPIFPRHLVISSVHHIPQSIWRRYQDMLDFVKENPDYQCFYNGPRSGASAPDHLHFQACPQRSMPLVEKIDSLIDSQAPDLTYLTSIKEARLYHMTGFANGLYVLRASTPKSISKLFYRLLDCAPVHEGEDEPRMNVISWKTDLEFRAVVIFRSKHRPGHYFSDGPGHLAMSPGCADMGGVFITTREDDFNKLDSALLEEVVKEVTISEDEDKGIIWRLTRTQEKLEVGIMSSEEIVFEIVADGAGPQRVAYQEGKISYNGALYDELTFEAQTEDAMFARPSFILHDVTIGVDFHWERKITRQYAGTLKFIVEEGKVTAVNIIGVEDYLLSVISSEMKPSAGLEFLKAHAVISRSWVMAQILNRKLKASKMLPVEELESMNSVPALVTALDSRMAASPDSEDHGGEYIKWFDHDDHSRFDVCADDHCQRYQGLTKAIGQTARKAVDLTWGKVLTYEGEVCDARFSKCCGGRTELFSTCWEEKEYPYLQSFPDTPNETAGACPFCDTSDEGILSQVLNDYDLETKDFYRWKTEYTRDELSSLVRGRSGIDFGTIRDLVPVERGPSGRLKKLRIVGDRTSMVIGKELIIRRWLSDSHLKSSAFGVKWEGDKLILEGSGWGHGVGLCQIGAAVMGAKGYSFEEILRHYYPGATMEEYEYE